ncbi:MAG: LPS assembly protein LptD [Devosia sp.]
MLAFCLFAAPALAQGLLPAHFLDFIPEPGTGPARVEADMLFYDSRLDIISAQGGVVMRYGGYTIEADKLSYNQRTGELHAIGNVKMTDAGGNVYDAQNIEVAGGMKEAFLQSLAITTSDGARIEATDVAYSAELKTILTEASYSPCGLCIDEKGRRIGWKVKAARMIYDRESASITLEQPALELLGMQVAWLPWFWFPDPTQPRKQGVRMPSLNYSAERGVSLAVPYFVPLGEDTDLLLSPMLMSRQGVLLAADLTHRFPGFGEITVGASGLYQLDPGAFTHTNVPPTSWRGAIQTSGRFTPAPDWVAGWSFTAFTDNAYLPDYGLAEGQVTNEIYATYLTADIFLDARIQGFRALGDYNLTNDLQQGMTLPWLRFSDVRDLGPGMGRANLTLDILGVHRGDDQIGTFGGVPYVFGNEGNKIHVTAEAAWETQWILPAGVTATPYLGARLDASAYDRTTAPIGGIYPTQSDTSLLSLTPIASMDFRWPLMAQNGLDTILFEPVAQFVYRGSSTTRVGITNDNAQSFVFDDANLFSGNRFTGTDRQETGVRANLGFHSAVNFANGGWLDVTAGQSFHLAGLNAMAVPDEVQVGTSTCLGGMVSCFVAGARGGYGPLEAAGKIQLGTSFGVRRAGLGAKYAADGYSARLGYQFIAADAALGTVEEHEIGGDVGVPIVDYWTANGGLDYDLSAGAWTEARAGLTYNDGFLTFGLNSTFKPGSFGVGVTFNLLGPTGDPAL